MNELCNNIYMKYSRKIIESLPFYFINTYNTQDN